MADRRDLTLMERNDETLLLTIDRQQPTDDLTTIATLELYLKEDACQTDGDAELVLTTADAAEMVIDTQTAAQITARAFLPASSLSGPYGRFWRIDGLTSGGLRRTAMYGDVTVVNL